MVVIGIGLTEDTITVDVVFDVRPVFCSFFSLVVIVLLLLLSIDVDRDVAPVSATGDINLVVGESFEIGLVGVANGVDDDDNDDTVDGRVSTAGIVGVVDFESSSLPPPPFPFVPFPPPLP